MTTRRKRVRPDVTVLKRRRLPGVSAVAVRREAVAILDYLGENEAELTISLVDDDTSQSLNRRYRKKDSPTDVLAFAMREGEGGSDPEVLGDVVISLDTAAVQARRRRHTLADEVRVLLVHGVLHLLGYDHERSAAEARRMQSMERRVRLHLRHR